MYCTRCGTQNTDGSRFCTACGAFMETGLPPVSQPMPSGFSPGGAASSYPSAPGRRLRRVIADKKIAGVCAGFAEYFDMDVTLVRLIWMALVLIPPAPGLIIYIVAWIILPKG